MKKIVFILLFSFISFAQNFPPIKIAARTNLKKGILFFGIKNLTNINVEGIAYIENADGIELLSTDVGFKLKPFEVKYFELPVRNARKDIPELLCESIIFDDKNSKLFSFKVRCKSGAKFREVGAQENIDFSDSFSKITERNLSFYFNKFRVIKKLNLYFNNEKILFEKSARKNNYSGCFSLNSNLIAEINLNFLFNNRGACVIVADYSLLKRINRLTKEPELEIIVPKKLLKNNLLALKYKNGKTELSQIKNAKINNDVEELCLVSEKGRVKFILDSSYCASLIEKSNNEIILKIKSRVEWTPPYPSRRAGTIFLPVVVSLAK